MVYLRVCGRVTECLFTSAFARRVCVCARVFCVCGFGMIMCGCEFM